MTPAQMLMATDPGLAVSAPVLRISYDADRDFLWGLIPGEVIDEHLEDETEPMMMAVDDETGEDEDCLWLYTRGPNGPLIGFGAAGAFDWDLTAQADGEASLWSHPRFDVPSLALRAASIGEILLAARETLSGSTPDVDFFDAAVACGSLDERETAEAFWRECLACGEMKAHFGLGYTLVELGRPREGFGHLAMYTEICPRNPWAWFWRGRAAEDMGERHEAGRSYGMALEVEQLASYETPARERLMAMSRPVRDPREGAPDRDGESQ